MRNRIIILWIVVGMFINCLAWKKSELPPTVSWSESASQLVVYQIRFQEKESWNPLMGTTYKENYTTILMVLQYNKKADQFSLLVEKIFPSWVLPGSVFWKSSSREIWMILGIDKDGFGTEGRRIIRFSLDSGQMETIWETENGKYLWSILPSPNGESLAFITSESATGMDKAELNIWKNKKIISTSIVPWIDSPTYRLSWEKNSTSIFLKRDLEVTRMDITSNSFKSSRATQFPDCFYPGTAFGSINSLENKELIFSDFHNLQTYKLKDNPNAIYFSEIPIVAKFSGKDCY